MVFIIGRAWALGVRMRTEILYMPDIEANYIREFEAKVLAKGTDHVVLDRTAFYAEGGGQPSDTGTLTWDDGKGGTASAKVLVVRKKGDITHHLEGPVPDVGTAVHGMLDWDRRWGHMRMHTSQHILSAVIFAEKKASTVGNQIHADHSRVDFAPVDYTMADAGRIEAMVNEVFAKNVPVTISETDRDVLEGKMDVRYVNISLIPKSVRRLRTVVVGDVDLCPCAGTHVRNTSEIGRMKITKIENKGKDRARIAYELVK